MKEILTFSQYFITYTVFFTKSHIPVVLILVYVQFVCLLDRNNSPILKVITDNPWLVWIELPANSIIVPPPPVLHIKFYWDGLSSTEMFCGKHLMCTYNGLKQPAVGWSKWLRGPNKEAFTMLETHHTTSSSYKSATSWQNWHKIERHAFLFDEIYEFIG